VSVKEVEVALNVIAPEDVEAYLTASPWPYMVGRPIHVACFVFYRPDAETDDLAPYPGVRVEFLLNGQRRAVAITDAQGRAGFTFTPETVGAYTITARIVRL